LAKAAAGCAQSEVLVFPRPASFPHRALPKARLFDKKDFELLKRWMSGGGGENCFA
jgi:hypothetical protein